jgi:radical SAM superfamily enzyme YgiQ (UPF0313 family)
VALAERLTLRPDATVLAVGEECVSSYDLAGRPYVLARGDASYRRALDGHVLEKRPAADGRPRLRQLLSGADAAAVVEAARREAEALVDVVKGGSLVAPEARDDALARLRRIASMDARALDEDAARFRAIYQPVGILPPDRYLSLVLQATEGCSWNACTFCELARGIHFRVKSAPEFEAHIAAVREYFGASSVLRRSLFLGDANALCIAHARLLPLVEAAARAFPGLALYAFVDIWSGHLKSAAEYAEYARLGLRCVYIGLESGDPELLTWLNKPGAPIDAVSLVHELHAAGVAVGVVVLIGAGGRHFAARHAKETASVLTRMRLGPEDIVFFSELVEYPTSAYARRAAEAGLWPLDLDECVAQREAILASLHPADPGRPPRSARYDVREFVY